jgi:hypothetical protein
LLTAGGLAFVIGVISLVCLVRLQSAGLSMWSGLLFLPIMVCSFLVITAVAGWQESPGGLLPQAWTVLAMFAVVLLGVIRILLPVSLDASRGTVWLQPVIVAVGMALLFSSMNLIAWLPNPGDWLRKRPDVSGLVVFLGATVLIVGAVAYLALPGRTGVRPAQPRPSDSLVVPLAVALIVLFAVFVARPRWAAARALTRRRTDGAEGPSGTAFSLIARQGPEATALLLVVAVVGFFALTRDLGVAVALFGASVAVFVSGSRGLVAVPARRDAADAGPLRLASIALVTFVAGVSLVIAFGSKALGIPRFGFSDALGYSDRQPTPFIFGNDLVVGPGRDSRFYALWQGKPGSAPDVLAVIGHEAGVLCLVALILVFALLFAHLGLLTIQVTNNRTGNAMAWGLIVFLAVQCLLAVETLFPVSVPVGEGPPLLAGGWGSYFADLIAIGVVIGLPRRASATVARHRASTENHSAVSIPSPA